MGSPRRFDFSRDTMAFANELYWEYSYAPDGTWTTKRRVPKPDYAHHCFVVARSTRQFFLNARFDASLPKADSGTYRGLVRKVVASNPRKPLRDSKKIAIPGYADLRSFTTDHERMVKDECGGAWQSYVQRGHWRMVLPFTRRQQQKVAQRLESRLESGQPLVLHVYKFPKLSINHALVTYGSTNLASGTEFTIYDPNDPHAPSKLFFRRDKRQFEMPPNNYFRGGVVKVYEVYHRWNY